VTTVAIIIPYFQRKDGILRRALTSILAQRLQPDTNIDIIIVDDGSPIPAATEAKGLDFAHHYHLKIIEQSNGGVASARNTGLAHVSADTAYIAFLDSDDIWDPEHLPRAIATLDLGLDYYFCDNRRDGSYESYFSLIAFNPAAVPFGKESGMENLYEIKKDVLFDSCLRICASLTSTIVYRRSIAKDLTFNTWLHPAGEDNLFFLQLISRAQRIGFSRQVLVTHADGIGIWHNRYGWDEPTHAISQLCRVLSAQEMKKNIPMSEANMRYIDGEITRLRRFYAYLSIRWLLKKRELWSAATTKLTRYDRAFWVWYPLAALYVTIGLPLRFYAPPKE
jgi:succinoglycan biosynthesis protein ExoW